MITNLTITEFRNLQPGDSIIINILDITDTATVEGYAFYNSDAHEPGWEIETDCGFIAFDSAYKSILPLSDNQAELIPLNRFKTLKPGDIIFVKSDELYVPVIVNECASIAISLGNILDNEEDWEVGTNIGYVHNDSAYQEIGS